MKMLENVLLVILLSVVGLHACGNSGPSKKVDNVPMKNGKKVIVLTDKNTITLDEKFTEVTTSQVQDKAFKMCHNNPGSTIYLVLNTPGGSIDAGMGMIHSLNALDCTFHTISIYAASMGYITAQHLGKRYVLPHGILMSHKASVGGIGGTITGSAEVVLNHIKRQIDEIDKTVSERIGMSVQAYRDLIANDLYLTAEEAVSGNHADEIVYARCDKSLMKETEKTVNTFFGQVKIKTSACPLVNGALGIN